MPRSTTTAAKIAALIAGLPLIFSSCLKVDELPPEPRIGFKSFEVFANDSASLVITFTDGDGDIGLDASDTVAPYDANLFIGYFEMQDGQWVDVDLGTDPFIPYRVPDITPTGQNPTLDGEIAIAMKPFSLYRNSGADTIKYDVRLRDRALHESNTVETGTIVP